MGRAAAIQLASKGAHVVVVARTVSKLQSTVDEMKVRVTPFVLFVSFTYTFPRRSVATRRSNASSTSVLISPTPTSVNVLSVKSQPGTMGLLLI